MHSATTFSKLLPFGSFPLAVSIISPNLWLTPFNYYCTAPPISLTLFDFPIPSRVQVKTSQAGAHSRACLIEANLPFTKAHAHRSSLFHCPILFIFIYGTYLYAVQHLVTVFEIALPSKFSQPKRRPFFSDNHKRKDLTVNNRGMRKQFLPHNGYSIYHWRISTLYFHLNTFRARAFSNRT